MTIATPGDSKGTAARTRQGEAGGESGPQRGSGASTRGARACRAITRQYARTFYFASHCLPRGTRQHAYNVYAFCRWTDNTVDEARDAADALRRLDEAREALALAYSDRPAPPGLTAFRGTVRVRGIPRELFEELLAGMVMDLTITRYADYATLDLYCYRVAGVVGLMMTHVFGYRHERCFPHAVALGRAMQLTNILRDVKEDLDRGRIYLPQDELERYGITETQLIEGRVDESFRRFMRFQIARARAAYAEADAGIPDLIGRSSRLTVRVMGRLYGAILDEIERLDYDVFSHRAATSTPRKLALLCGCLGATFRDDVRCLGFHRP